MASITLRNGKYLVRVRRPGATASKTFTCKREAAAWAASVELSIERGTFREEERSREASSALEGVTLRDLAGRYLIEVTPTKRGGRQEGNRLRALLRGDSEARPLMDRPVAALRPQDVAKWRDRRLRLVTGSTVNREWALMAHILTVARLDWGYLGSGCPFKDVRKPAENRARDRRIEAGELEAICGMAATSELAAFIRLAVETAARRGELLALEWRDVNLQAAVMTLRQTKNGEVRTIPLTPAAVTLLASLPRPIHGGPVFSLAKDRVSHGFNRAMKRARAAYVAAGGDDPQWLVGIRLHDARHEACSRLAESGFSTLEVAAVSGHKTLQLLKRYTHLRPEALAAKLAALASA